MRLNTQHIASARWPNRMGVACLVLMAVGIIIATVVEQTVQNALQSSLRAEFVLDSEQAGSFAAWASSTADDAPVLYAAYYIYNIT
jgi:hypothetical protein